ncbi:MAG TPA: YajG family lipoprotein [Chthoniobacterales bacterium]|jgi:uncharacterized lipoprotein YajG
MKPPIFSPVCQPSLLFAAVVASILAGCATPSSVAPLSVPLSYKTMAEPGDFSTLPPCAAISEVQVVDARSDKTIGKRYIEDKPSAIAPVTAASDVAAWVRSGAEQVLKQSGVSLGKPGAPILRLSVEQIRTNENVVHRSGYDGRIVISGKLSKPGSGRVCWVDRASGAAENYGYTGSVENYQETLNHALDRAIIAFTNTAGFREAVCRCGK